MIPWVRGTVTKLAHYLQIKTGNGGKWRLRPHWHVIQSTTGSLRGTLIKHVQVHRVYCFCLSILGSGSGSMWYNRRHGRRSEKLGGTMGIASVTLNWKPHRRWPAADVCTTESTIFDLQTLCVLADEDLPRSRCPLRHGLTPEPEKCTINVMRGRGG